MTCHITNELNKHLAEEEAAEAKAEWEAEVISERKSDLLTMFSVMTKLEIDIYLSTNYDFDLAEFVAEHMNDDGIAEYYIQDQSQYFRAAMLNILENLDYTDDIERELERLEEL